MENVKQKIIEQVNKVVENYDFEADILTDPPRIELGEFALPCFLLAKEQKKSPQETAKNLAELLTAHKNDFWQKVESEGPYINFQLKEDFWFKSVLLDDKKINTEKRKKIMIEFSQPNTHKQFHVGHLRNVNLGMSLVKIYRYLGHKVIGANYIGDIGTHVAKCLWNYQKNHLDDNLPSNKGKYLGDIYTEATQKIDDNEQLKVEVSNVLQNLEKREKTMTKLWRETKEWSMQQFYAIYDELNVVFDVWYFESEEEKEADKLIRKLAQDSEIKVIKHSQGAIIADLQEFDLGVLVLIKSDGTKAYGAKDLPLTKKKFDKNKLDEAIWVMDKRQSLYLKQIFKLMEILGYNKKMIHVSYDFVTTSQGTMSSRKGNIIAYEDFYLAMVNLLIEQTRQKHPEWSNQKINQVACAVAMSAIKFGMLKYENNSLVVFDMGEALSFEGATGPYLLYTYARINSIQKKANQKPVLRSLDYSLLQEREEKILIKQLSRFQDIVLLCAKENQPSYLCTYLIELAQKFNSFYHKYSIIKADARIKNARLLLLSATQEKLRLGLDLLNIAVLDEM